MKILQKSQEKASFVTDAEQSLLNAIRRSALEIPILAIDEVEFYKNDSVLYDEILALRLALVPIETPKNMTMQEKCSCKGKGCARCSVQFKLVAKGPCTVYSKELKGKAKPVYPDIPLAILAEGQELELVAKARLGKGIGHTKFSPGLVYYRNVAEIEADKECRKCESCVDACPQNILKLDGDKIVISDKYKCDFCEACVEACRREGKNMIKISPGKELIFFIESWGQIKAADILAEAVKALKDNLKAVK